MQGAMLSPLAAWQNFYVIVGTAAATLTGLLFVVVALIAQLRVPVSAPRNGVAIYSTPNVVHFGTALLIAALDSVPWSALWNVSLLLGLVGLGGVIYLLSVLWLTRYRLPDYQPVFSDWLWHTILPLASYAAIVIAAILLTGHPAPALFVIAGATLLLLFIGIHNAWDVVTYTAFEFPRSQDTSQDQGE